MTFPDAFLFFVVVYKSKIEIVYSDPLSTHAKFGNAAFSTLVGVHSYIHTYTYKCFSSIITYIIDSYGVILSNCYKILEGGCLTCMERKRQQPKNRNKTKLTWQNIKYKKEGNVDRGPMTF